MYKFITNYYETKKLWKQEKLWNGKIEKEANVIRSKAATGDTAVSYKDHLDILANASEMQVKKAEETDLIKAFTALNLGFETRVKDENREVDVKNRNEKRATKSPMEKSFQKKRGVESPSAKQN